VRIDKELIEIWPNEVCDRTFRREKLPERFTAKRLFGWTDKRYDQEYWGRLEKNWRRWKGS